jgi:(p)ppGpp synthase/HD superfamily hydrolase
LSSESQIDKDIELQILGYLQKKQTATNTAIAKEFSLNEKDVNKILNRMRQAGLVQFQQELHLTRGDLIMAKISGKGTTTLLSPKTEPIRQLDSGYDFGRISEAFEFASAAHKEGFRKGKMVPYIVHPLDVFSILLKNGATEDLAIAGLLHDVLEDTSRTRDEVRKNFGDAVGNLVEGASESEKLTKGVSNDEKKKTWKLRKTERIEKVKNSGRDLRLLICADKLSNIRDLLEDLHSDGENIWTKFNSSKDEQSWYYHEMASAMATPSGNESDISKTIMYGELQRCIHEVFGS